MSVIHMETEKVRETVGRLNQSIYRLMDSCEDLNRYVNRVDRNWEGGRSENFLRRARSRISNLNNKIEQLDILRNLLEREIGQWEEMDGIGETRNDRWKPRAQLPGTITQDDKEEIDWILDNISAEGKAFLLGGTMLGAAGGFYKGENVYGEYLAGNFEWRGEGYEFTLEEMEALEFYQKNGKLPEGWGDPKKQEVLEGKIKLYEKELGTARWAALSGKGGSEKTGYEYSVLSAEATASAGVEIKKGSLTAGVEGQAGAYLGKVSGKYSTPEIPLGPLALGGVAAGTAFVGAEIAGKAKFVGDLKNGTLGVQVGGEAFAGGKASGEVGGSLSAGGVKGSVKGSGSINYGAGVKGKVDIGMNKYVIKGDVELGATLGLGFDFGVEFELDLSELVGNLMETNQMALMAI